MMLPPTMGTAAPGDGAPLRSWVEERSFPRASRTKRTAYLCTKGSALTQQQSESREHAPHNKGGTAPATATTMTTFGGVTGYRSCGRLPHNARGKGQLIARLPDTHACRSQALQGCHHGRRDVRKGANGSLQHQHAVDATPIGMAQRKGKYCPLVHIAVPANERTRSDTVQLVSYLRSGVDCLKHTRATHSSSADWNSPWRWSAPRWTGFSVIATCMMRPPRTAAAAVSVERVFAPSPEGWLTLMILGGMPGTATWRAMNICDATSCCCSGHPVSAVACPLQPAVQCVYVPRTCSHCQRAAVGW